MRARRFATFTRTEIVRSAVLAKRHQRESIDRTDILRTTDLFIACDDDEDRDDGFAIRRLARDLS